MTYISGEYCFYTLERDEDESGVSGTGRVAYVVDLGPDGVLTLFDTRFDIDGVMQHSHGVDILPHMDMADVVHGHGGKTRFVPVTDPLTQTRLEHLLDLGVARLGQVYRRFTPIHLRSVPAEARPTLAVRAAAAQAEINAETEDQA